MAKKNSATKVDTSAQSSALANPFATLSSEGLPAGPEVLASKSELTPVSSKKGRVVLRRETAQRGGKVVVVAGDFEEQIPDEEIEELARELRKACGCGGTVREREIEIQGDQPAKICAFLLEAGFRVAGVRS